MACSSGHIGNECTVDRVPPPRFSAGLLDFAARALCLDPVSALHSTKMKALEHELASVKEDRKRLQEIETKHLTIVNEVRR